MISCVILFAQGPIAYGQAVETAKQPACRITAISFSLILNLPWRTVSLKTWQNKKAKKEKLIPLSELFRVLGKQESVRSVLILLLLTVWKHSQHA